MALEELNVVGDGPHEAEAPPPGNVGHIPAVWHHPAGTCYNCSI